MQLEGAKTTHLRDESKIIILAELREDHHSQQLVLPLTRKNQCSYNF